MENRISHPMPSSILWVLVSLAAFIGAFQTAYYQDIRKMKDLTDLALSHFQYADSLHDDMGIIDWAKDLEKLDEVRAFRIKINERIVVEGGNRDLLPPTIQEGAFYHLPSNWTYQVTSASNPAQIKTFDLVFSSSPGPLSWGLAVGFWTLFTGAVFLYFPFLAARKNAPSQSRRLEESDPQPLVRNQNSDPQEVRSTGSDILFVDSHFIIHEAGDGVASLLGKSSQNLRSLHLLDLNPDPALIQAMEKGVECDVPNPLPEYGKMNASLKIAPGGFHIHLKSQQEAKTSQNR